MSRRLTIYVPDDVAARLEKEENASAFLVEAARRTMHGEATRAGLAACGYPEIPQELVDEQMNALADEERRRHDPDLVARMNRRLSELAQRTS